MRNAEREAIDSRQLLALAEADERLTRSISRQVMIVVGAAVLLAAIFLSATAQAVALIDKASITAERERVRAALEQNWTRDAGGVARIGEAYLLEGARLTTPDAVQPREVAEPLPAGEGRVLAWVPKRIGAEIFLAVAPVRISAAVLLLCSIAFILHRLHKLARSLETRRAAARLLASRDPLTGLANRLEFNEQLERELVATATGRRSALVLLDLDGFKAVNDHFGHLAGDALLRETAARLQALAASGDLVARLGGDEFAIIRRERVGRDELTAFCAAIVRCLSVPYFIDNEAVSVTVSAGVACLPQDAPDAEAAVRAADAALYRAKAQRGGRYETSAAVRGAAA